MITMITLLGISIAILSLANNCKGENCLSGYYHKSSSGPEPGMRECSWFSESSCCFSNYTELLAVSPVSKVVDTYWDRCGNLSLRCEEYMKKIDCFYHCSPLAYNWINPNNSYSIFHVPICESFCDDWFAACMNDRTCVRNWITDWQWDEHGNNCVNECIPYREMYRNGKDLCENMWGTSFKVPSCPCDCLMMDHDDNNVVQHLQLHNSGISNPAEALDRENDEAFCQQRQKSLRERKERNKNR
ncbi:riboflavin-binding protein-like [Pristis pectinata]|uniref:riboflavin-binding protein-like n=1 Tax=Pristis pectinata TaxID=685728 RepID=UPI00223D80FF|nr:riboflavin-binding protein-like [Pristis pectinata]